MGRRRPSAIDVYFTREDEVRFDYHEPLTTGTADITNPDRVLENVLQLPDPELLIGSKRYGQGSWVQINQALLNAWNTDLPPKILNGSGTTTLKPITFDFIRQSWGNGFMLWRLAGQPLEDPI